MARLSSSISIAVLFVLGVVISLGCGSDDKVTDSQNNPPLIISVTADPATFHALVETTTITVIAQDPDSDTLRYGWDWASWLPIGLVPGEGNIRKLTNCCQIQDSVIAWVKSIVTDGRGGEARDSVWICIKP